MENLQRSWQWRFLHGDFAVESGDGEFCRRRSGEFSEAGEFLVRQAIRFKAYSAHMAVVS